MIKKILLVIGVSIESVETQTLKYNKKKLYYKRKNYKKWPRLSVLGIMFS